jgi:hypothetical protein
LVAGVKCVVVLWLSLMQYGEGSASDEACQ